MIALYVSYTNLKKRQGYGHEYELKDDDAVAKMLTRYFRLSEAGLITNLHYETDRDRIRGYKYVDRNDENDIVEYNGKKYVVEMCLSPYVTDADCLSIVVDGERLILDQDHYIR